VIWVTPGQKTLKPADLGKPVAPDPMKPEAD
jgi:hypothetical protein